MKSVLGIVTAVALGGLGTAGCNRSPTAEVICRALEKEKIAEGCQEGPDPLFSVPRFKSQWTFKMAELSEGNDPVLGKLPKPSGVVIQFESLGDRDTALDYLKGMNSVMPVFPFAHKLEQPPLLVLMPKHDGSLRSRGFLDRAYGYSK